ncbi:MAG: DoxX family protein [Alphaproteobacteria bacterium]|nr:DoxX family protein [Alphaproteobacteria bacterium]
MAASSTDSRLIIPALAGLYDALACAAYPIVRITAGLFLMPHGAQKLFGMWGGNIEATAGFFEKVGLSPGLPLAYLVGFIEFFGGLCVAIGFLTRPFAAAGAFLLFVAAFKVHLGAGFFVNKGGYEYALMWALLMVAVFCRGPGPFSVDRRIGKEF